MSTNTPHTTTSTTDTSTSIDTDEPGEPTAYAGYHDVLLSDEDRTYPPAEHVIELREYMRELPETQTTFKLKAAIDGAKGVGSAVHDIIGLVGAWRLPPIYPNGEVQGLTLVHPSRPDAERYTDAYTYCECGALFTKLEAKDSEDDAAIRGANRHNDGCAVYHRHEMKAALHRERERILTTALDYGISGDRLATRLGISSANLGAIADAVGVSPSDRLDTFRDRRANTAADLARLGYSRQEIATIYGIDPSVVSRDIKRATGRTMTEIADQPPHFQLPGSGGGA